MTLFLLGILLLSFVETWLWMRAWVQTHNQELPDSGWRTAVAYCTGVSDYTNVSLREEQLHVLAQIQERLEIERCLPEILPPIRLKVHAPFNIVVSSLRNFWQAFLAINCSNWMGPALAQHLATRLGKPKPGATLLVVCQSAGASLALAAAPELSRLLGCRILLVSFGGVFSSTAGFDHIDAFFHFVGDKDGWTRSAALCLAGRRETQGPLARAKHDNRYFELSSGPHEHYGTRGYMGKDVQLTVDALTGDPIKQFL